MRALLGLTLLALAAAEQCPIKGILGWLKEHGPEVLETVEECRHVPAIMMKIKSNKECYAEESTADKATMALWYAITGLQHMSGTIGEFAKESPMMKKIESFALMDAITRAHKGAQKFCGNDKCTDQVKDIQSTIGTCYASLACNFMDKVVPFGSCKTAMNKYIETTMESSMVSMCLSDSMQGRPYYCAELNSYFMFKDFDCYLEMKSSASQLAKCTPKCVHQWEMSKKKMPRCSKVVNYMQQQVFDNIKIMLKDMAKDAKIDMKKIIDGMPKHVPTYDEKCLAPPPSPMFPYMKAQLYGAGAKPFELKIDAIVV